MTTEDLQNLYQTYLGEVPEEIVELPSSGSILCGDVRTNKC